MIQYQRFIYQYANGRKNISRKNMISCCDMHIFFLCSIFVDTSYRKRSKCRHNNQCTSWIGNTRKTKMNIIKFNKKIWYIIYNKHSTKSNDKYNQYKYKYRNSHHIVIIIIRYDKSSILSNDNMIAVMNQYPKSQYCIICIDVRKYA